jgi:hypothetical protein
MFTKQVGQKTQSKESLRRQKMKIEEFRKLPDKIKNLKMEILTRKRGAMLRDRELEGVRSRHKLSLATKRGDDGKFAYPNEKARESALILTLGADVIYQKQLTNKDDNQYELDLLVIELEGMKDQLRVESVILQFAAD